MDSPSDRLRALERGFWTDSPSETARLERQLETEGAWAIRVRLDEAWETGDLESFSRIAEVLWRADRLKPNRAFRFAELLIRSDRFAEAVELLSQPSFGYSDAAIYWVALARAQAGAGDLDAATDSVRRALDLDPASAAAGKLSSRLALIARGVGEPAPFWGACIDLAEVLIELGLYGRAVDQIAALADAQPPFDQAAYNRLLWVCINLHRFLDAGERARLHAGLRVLGPPADRDWAADRRGSSGGQAPGAGKAGPDFRLLAALDWAASGRANEAIELLGKLASGYPKHHTVRYELARLVGRQVLAEHPVVFRESGPPRIFDLFPFNGEFDLLEIKLREMSPWVDHFVIVEAPVTFTGLPKPLYFDQAKARFAEFASKLVHVVVDGFPAHVRHAWAREFYQRDFGVTGASGLMARDDLVFITDADEVIDRRKWSQFQPAYTSFGLRTYAHVLNLRRAVDPANQSRKSALIMAKDLAHHGLSFVRNGIHRYRKHWVGDAGWHFTLVRSPEDIAYKFRSYSHQEHQPVSVQAVEQHIEKIRAGRAPKNWEFCEIDDTYPAFIRDNPERFAPYMLHPPERSA